MTGAQQDWGGNQSSVKQETYRACHEGSFHGGKSEPAQDLEAIKS